MSIEAIILAGGKGTRLQKVISGIPKPLAPVGGRPFLDILLNQLKDFDQISKVVLAVGYRAESIVKYYKSVHPFPFSIDFSKEETPLGTGGAIKLALAKVGSENVLVLNGDSYTEFDLRQLLEFHENHEGKISMLITHVDDVSRYGEVEFDTNSGRVTGFKEKSDKHLPGYINAGVYLLKATLVDELPALESFSFESEVLPQFIKRGVFGHPSYGKFIDIGLPESYSSAEQYLGDSL